MAERKHNASSAFNGKAAAAAFDATDEPDTPAKHVKPCEKQNICVGVRVRPSNDDERKTNTNPVVTVNSRKNEIIVQSKEKTTTYAYDKVFGPGSEQVEIYREMVAPILIQVLDGYNCTIFAYGQTGTGKTFTMEGGRPVDGTVVPAWETSPLAGVIPRTLHDLFEKLEAGDSIVSIRVSFVELYNEELYDLLSASEDTQRLALIDDPGSVIMQGVEEFEVRSEAEVYQILDRGTKKRAKAATSLKQSIRSHSVFAITVHCREPTIDGEDLLKTGKLYLVDLAGSENVGRSGSTSVQLREAGSINQSLLTLGRVITLLCEHGDGKGAKASLHVPYRDSKLTRLLQDSLGGRTKTSIIATVSPSSVCLEETVSTLQYALKARNIRNRPEVNQRITKKALLKQYAEENDRLRRDLLAAREKNGIYVTQETFDEMNQTIASQKNMVAEHNAQLDALREELDAMRSQHAVQTAQMDRRNQALEAEVARLGNMVQERDVEIGAAEQQIGQLQGIIDEKNAELGRAFAKIDTVEEKNHNSEITVDVKRTELLEASVKINDGLEKIEALESDLEYKNELLASIQQQSAETQQKLEETASKLSETQKNYHRVANEREELQYLLAEAQRRENTLYDQMDILLAISQDATQNVQLLRGKLEQKTEKSKANERVLGGFQQQLMGDLQNMQRKLEEMAVNVHAVLEKEVVHDSPGGKIPRRNSCRLPEAPNQPTPRDARLARFRAQRAQILMPDIVDAVLDDESVDDLTANGANGAPTENHG